RQLRPVALRPPQQPQVEQSADFAGQRAGDADEHGRIIGATKQVCEAARHGGQMSIAQSGHDDVSAKRRYRAIIAGVTEGLVALRARSRSSCSSTVSAPDRICLWKG